MAAQPMPEAASAWSDGLSNLIAAGQSQSWDEVPTGAVKGDAGGNPERRPSAVDAVSVPASGEDRDGQDGCALDKINKEESHEEEGPFVGPNSSEGAALQALASLSSTTPPPCAPTSDICNEEDSVSTSDPMLSEEDAAPPAGAMDGDTAAEAEPM